MSADIEASTARNQARCDWPRASTAGARSLYDDVAGRPFMPGGGFSLEPENP